MSEVNWYRAAFALPLIAPVVSAGVWFGLQETILPPGSALPTATILVLAVPMILVFSGVFGAIPYVIFAAPTLLLLWNRPAASWRRTAPLLPVLFVPVLILFLHFVFAPMVGAEVAEINGTTVRSLGMFSGVALALGYFYVFVVLGVGHWLRRRTS